MSLSASDFEYVCRLVRKRSAIVLDAGKEYLAESRLAALVRQEGFESLQELVAQLRQETANSGLDRKVVEAMTTNETTFFRDVNPFEALRKTILPALIERRAAQRSLSIWSAACSSGQEPYSIAMLLREHFVHLTDWTIRIVATDLSRSILGRARSGRFSQLEVNRGLPAPLLVKYFQKQGAEWQLCDEVRSMVEFRELNLAESWPPLGEQDVVFMRNVLIYFDVDTKKTILARVRRILRPGGYLFLGGAETTINLDATFERALVDNAPCYRLPAT